MSFELQIEKSMVLELDLSFSMLIRPPSAKLAKYLYMGPDWTKNINKDLLNEANSLQNNTFLEFSKFFAWKSPYKENLQLHINWLKDLSMSDMYHLLSPIIGDGNSSFPFDIENQRNYYVSALEKWYQGFFKLVEDQYSEKIKNHIDEVEKRRNEGVDIVEFVEEVTGGLMIDPSADVSTVVLFPHIYYRPIFTSCVYTNIVFASYSPQFEDDRVVELEWLTNFGRAISDEIRVKMIQILSQRKVTFSELTKEIGSTKANIHHHLLILRVAKLLRMYETGDRATFGYYSIRPNIIETLTAKLNKIML